jgi:cathepsin F
MASTEVNFNFFHGPSSLGHMSVQQLLDCVSVGESDETALIDCKGCWGGWPQTGMRHVVSEGAVLDEDYGYEGVTGQVCASPKSKDGNNATTLFPLKDVLYLPQWNETAMAGAVAEHGSIVAVINVPSDLATYSDGVYDNPLCCTGLPQQLGTCLQHGIKYLVLLYYHILSHSRSLLLLSIAITIVGYGVDPTPYWIVRNSWSPAWGDRGYMKMAKGVDTCGIEANPVLPIAS